MRSEDRSATCCHHRHYHLCRKDNNNNLINKRYEQIFLFFHSVQSLQVHHRRLRRRHSSSPNSFLTMDAKEIQKRIVRLKDDIEREVRDRLPRKVGIVAVNHFKQNFRDAGWRDDGLHPWKTTQRQREGGPDAKYTPLTSRRDHLDRKSVV